tara:strand:+ start:240 stop:464 length:225 start_codon:yes stop_codon:yes gene_type:complete
MKGVKYNLNFRLPNGDFELFENLNMNELIGISKQKVYDCYDIQIKMSNHIVYNLMNRNNVNPFLKSICKIQKCI